MTVLVKVFGISAVVLGVFMLFAYLLPSSPSCQYNIGCYLAPHSLNHTSQLHARISDAKAQLAPMAYQYRSIIGDEQVFEKKVLSVAFSFEKYAQQLAKEQ